MINAYLSKPLILSLTAMGNKGKITLVFYIVWLLFPILAPLPENGGSFLAICFVSIFIHFFLVTIWLIKLTLFHVAKYLDI